jgi:hypothetical protein
MPVMVRIAFSRELWPLVLVRFPSAPVSDDAIDEYLEQLEANFTRGSRYALVTDFSRSRHPFSLGQRKAIDRWLGDHRDLITKWRAANAVVVTWSPLARGIVAANYRYFQHYPRDLHKVVGSYAEGVDWALERLAAESILLDAAEVAARREQAIRWETPDLPVKPSEPTAAPPADLYAPLLEMFDEPVFLVTRSGDLVHANQAAAKRYPQPPAWLAQTVAVTDTGRAVEAPQCRVTDIETGDGGWLYLVIPEQAISTGPAPTIDELPPSLRPVARLLAQGLSDKEIAEACELSFATVRTYVTRIFKRMGVHSRAELAARWRE